ncbi:MAG: hypothetical protein V1704_02650 [Candidatus Vogelbacteria bacterium]
MSKQQKNNSGFVALVVVVIVGAAVLVLALSTALLGVRELELVTTIDHGVAAKAFTDGCLDTALLALRLNPAPANADFTDSTGRCIITVSDEGDGNRLTVVRGIVGENEQSLTVRLTTVPANHSITINNYTL